MSDPKLSTELVPVKNRDIFGDLLLIQIVATENAGIVLPDGSMAMSENHKMLVAGIGDGERVKKFKIGDEVDLLHYDTQKQKMRRYDDIDYAVIGYDFVLSRVRAS